MLSKELIQMKKDLYAKINDPNLKADIALVFGQYNLEMDGLRRRIKVLEGVSELERNLNSDIVIESN